MQRISRVDSSRRRFGDFWILILVDNPARFLEPDGLNCELLPVSWTPS
jgi:hypothetical protein